ncbi:MAG: DUF1287 domain-containing protein [Bacillota bacterium]
MNLIPQKSYTAEDFGIQTVKSDTDFDHDGIDDYTDILLETRKDAEVMPVYKSAYYAGGYLPNMEGVCTDLVWRALANAVYNLKVLVDEDIAKHIAAYPRVEGKPDPNIDFRRVANLKIFFERNCTSLTLDIHDIGQWQPGDIVTFGTNHIAVVSDKRNSGGVPYIIHNAGQPVREEDALSWPGISGHFRFAMDMSSFVPQPSPPAWG